jgi:hypothetical protein
MTLNDDDLARAMAEGRRLKDEAVNRLVDLHPEALANGLDLYGSILRWRDLATVISRRESKLKRQHAVQVATLRKAVSYDRTWIGLLRLLRDLTVCRGLP